MKYFAALLALACTASAQNFYSGQAARLLIGQQTFTSQRPGVSASELGAAAGVAYANDTLFVADSSRVGAAPNNNRVLLFRNVRANLPQPGDSIPQRAGTCLVCVGIADVVLGQPDFSKNEFKIAQNGFRLPTAIASDGRVLAVADTDNNRVLIWRTIPTNIHQNADVVLGQENFTTVSIPRADNKSLRGPQGVWIQDGKLYVADTQNHRVMVWNSIPSSNNAPADFVLGQADFNVAPGTDLARTQLDPKATTLLNPVSVTSDGTRLYVADLGHNRVLIWNRIPTRTQEPADIALGQPDVTSAAANNSSKVCAASGKTQDGKDLFPQRCAATLDFPRFALSDGKRLFVADGGNDRVLVWNTIPTNSGQAADVVLGQPTFEVNVNSDNANPLGVSSADTMRTPTSLAWDGQSLYVADPFNRRVLVFTPGERFIPYTGVRNLASRDIFAVGYIQLTGKIKENDELTIKVGTKEYKYKIVKDDTFEKVINQFVTMINAGAGDPLVLASPNLGLNALVLTARNAGEAGNAVEITATPSAGAEIGVQTSGGRLAGGQDAAKIAPGTLVTILGEDFTDRSESVDLSKAEELPRELAGVQVFFNGIQAPLLMATPNQINAQVPFELSDTTSINAIVRALRNDGRRIESAAAAVPIIPQNPGIFAEEGTDPRPAVAYHFSSFATGTVSVDGGIKAGDVATVIIEDREYTYTVQSTDTLFHVRDRLVDLINENPDEKVIAYPSGVFSRIRLRAKEPGEAGNGIGIGVRVSSGAVLILTPTNSGLCCANKEGERITKDNPAIPGETIIIHATGLGLVLPREAQADVQTGKVYRGTLFNEPNSRVDSLAGGKTANVLYAGLKQGMIGVYELHLELNSDIPTNEFTQLTIAQDIYVSNIVTIPVKNPKDEEQQ